MVESLVQFLKLGTFGRPSGDFRRVFRHRRKRHSYNAKVSRCLQIFVLWRLTGMLAVQSEGRWLYLEATITFS